MTVAIFCISIWKKKNLRDSKIQTAMPVGNLVRNLPKQKITISRLLQCK